MQCSKSTIYPLIRRYQATGNTADRHRTGRPRVTTPAEDRYVRVTMLRNHFQTATVLAATLPGGNISSDNVRRRLREYGIRARRAHRGPILTVRHRIARLDWARRHLCFGRLYWNSVIFSNETRINLRQADGRIRVYRRRGERFSDECVVETDRFGGGSVLIWGGICAGRKTPIVFIAENLTAQRYRDEVLDTTSLPFMNMYGPGLIFQAVQREWDNLPEQTV